MEPETVSENKPDGLQHRVRRPVMGVALAVFLLTILWVSSGYIEKLNDRPPPVQYAGERWKGIALIGGHEIAVADLAPLRTTGANVVSLNFDLWQEAWNTPEVRRFPQGTQYWGRTDAGLRRTAELAQAAGLRTALVPHVQLENEIDGRWRGMIEMENEAAWQAWFASYGQLILDYARLAEESGIDLLVIGLELRVTVNTREADWRRLIAQVRKVYQGQITYAANWDAEFAEVPFWDALDFIGVQAYFPLVQEENAPLEELLSGWQPFKEQLRALSQRTGKPVIFTEIGYKTTADAAIEPWTWLNWRPRENEPAAPEFQARCYEAVFQTFWHEPWFAGIFWWEWYPRPEWAPDKVPKGFSPQGKPAEAVIRKWFAESGES